MAQSNVCLVALATAWGPRHGGINAFNVEWVRSLGVNKRRDYRLACVVPAADAADHEDAGRHHVRLVALGAESAALPAEKADDVLAALRATADLNLDHGTVVWLGHDDKTGPLALALRTALPGSRAVLVHHMAFRAYQDVKKDGDGAVAKRDFQKQLFSDADQCLAVGPMLADHLRDLLGPERVVTMLVPGLAEPDPKAVTLLDQPPANFVAFLGGRLGSDDERIKQAQLGVRGVGRAIRKAKDEAGGRNALCRSPSLRMRGVPPEQQAQVQREVEEEANAMVECDLDRYTEDRNRYFNDLASSSVALMPSWHEGFGLVAWEAIACQVPVVIGEQSGVFRLLDTHWQGAGLGRSVRAVSVDGQRAAAGKPAHTDSDVQAIAEALFQLGEFPIEAKADAIALAQRLRHDHSWKDCAETTLNALERGQGLTCRLAAERASPSPAGQHSDVNAALALPPRIPEILQPPTPLSSARLRQLGPSALLAAHDQVVRFHPARDAFVEGLLASATAPGLPRLTLQGVHGPGGIGKTRSALELLKRASARGWAGLWLPARLPDNALDAWRDLLASHTQPLLLVVDYADGRQPELLRWLASALDDSLQTGRDAPRVHVLCLSRGTDWWAQLPRQPECSADLAAMLTGGSAYLGLRAVPDWPDAPTDRAAAFDAALQDYANALGSSVPPFPWRPDFSAADYGRPLYLHLAALAALDGERPRHGTALLAAQLLREWRHWQRSAPESVASADAYDNWTDALALLALAQGLDADALGTALARLTPTRAAELTAALLRAYPRDDGGAGALTPDLLGEHLLLDRLSLPRAPTWLALAINHDEPRLTRALEVLARLWPRHWPDDADRADDDRPAHLGARRIVEALTAVWPRHGQALVNAVHRHGMALRAPVTQAWRALPAEMKAEIAFGLRLPKYSTPLLDLTVKIRRQLVASAVDEPQRAGALNDLGVALSELGDAASRAEALACAREAVSIRRLLADEQPAAFWPYLAASLNNLANRLSERGDAASRAEALTCAREAVSIRRQLANKQPAAFRPALALSLNTLANRLSEQGDAASRAEALACAREAVSIHRQLADEQPVAFWPDLAMSLNNLANRLSERGDAASRDEALTCAREAVSIRRQLADEQPAAFRPALALSLNNLASDLYEQGDAASRAEALACAREAVSIYRQFADEQPAAFWPYLAASLNNLASHLSEQGDAASRAEAFACAREAVLIYRRLADEQPAAFRPNLATSLNNLANGLSEQGDAASRAEAFACAREAVSIHRQLADEQPAAFRPDLAMSLDTLANCLSKQGDAASRADALACAREAVLIYRRLADEQPAAFRPNLATSLNTLANCLSEQGDAASRHEALACAREAVSIYSALHRQMPAAFERNLRIAEQTLARMQSRPG